MGTSTAVIGAAAALVVVLALVAGLAVRARNRSDRLTEAAIKEVGTSIDGMSNRLEEIVDHARPEGAAMPVGVTLDLDELLLRIAAAAASLYGVEAGAVRAERRGGTVERSVGLVSGATGLDAALDPPDRRSWRAVELMWHHDDAAGEPIRSAMVVPIDVEGRRIGVVGAYSRTAGGVDDTAAHELVQLATEVGPALDAALTHADTKDLVVTDALTGFLNRRGYDEVLVRECALAARAGRPLSVLMVDLDDFHDVNNRHGYPVGDAVLRAFCDAMRTVARVTDIGCRRGGEEFVLVLPDTSCEGAQGLDQRLRAIVAATTFPGAGTASYSGGITCWSPESSDDAPSAETLDERASTAVRRAKDLGKDRTIVIDPPPGWTPVPPGAPTA